MPLYRTLDWAATSRYESSLGYGVFTLFTVERLSNTETKTRKNKAILEVRPSSISKPRKAGDRASGDPRS